MSSLWLWLWQYNASSCLKSSHSTDEKCCPNTTRWEHLVPEQGTGAGARGGDLLGLLNDNIKWYFYKVKIPHLSTSTSASDIDRIDWLELSSIQPDEFPDEFPRPRPRPLPLPLPRPVGFFDGRILVLTPGWPSSSSFRWLELDRRWGRTDELVCQYRDWVEQTKWKLWNNKNKRVNIIILPRLVDVVINVDLNIGMFYGPTPKYLVEYLKLVIFSSCSALEILVCLGKI